MPVSQRQFDQLSEMGISLWQHKAQRSLNNSQSHNTAKPIARFINIDNAYLSDLAEKNIFTDTLLACNISIGEVTIKSDHLDLGLFNWYFTIDEKDAQSIRCQHNKLFSPNILLISQSTKLKKLLWQTISNHLI